MDGVKPVFVSAAVDGSSLTLTYGEALDGGSRPATGDFTVEVGGSGRSITGVAVSQSMVMLTLNPAVEHGDTGIRVSYTPGTNPIQDTVGNDAVMLSNRPVTNTTDAPNTDPEITTRGPLTVRENQALVRQLVGRDTDAGDEVTGWGDCGRGRPGRVLNYFRHGRVELPDGAGLRRPPGCGQHRSSERRGRQRVRGDGGSEQRGGRQGTHRGANVYRSGDGRDGTAGNARRSCHFWGDGRQSDGGLERTGQYGSGHHRLRRAVPEEGQGELQKCSA